MTNIAPTKTVFEALEDAYIENANFVTEDSTLVTWLHSNGEQTTILYSGADTIRGIGEQLQRQLKKNP
jgi:hypothetical protein